MTQPSSLCVAGTEYELLTAPLSFGSRAGLGQGVNEVFSCLRKLAPCLPSSSGCFTPYGRTYLDCGHLELASLECDDPYALADLHERGERLLCAAVRLASRRAPELLLVVNNHDGLLKPGAATWGAHESYRVWVHPSRLVHYVLPFLASRIFAGSGGLAYPSGAYLAGVRPLFMQEVVGGGTTTRRAIVSLAREEHHSGPTPTTFRFHLLIGDAHRILFNYSLQIGATMLALKAIENDSELRDCMDRAPGPRHEQAWLELLNEFNHYAAPGEPPRANPLALQVQRVYLNGARRFVDGLAQPPSWMPRILEDWERTLRALEEDDREWLCGHLDAFAKHGLIESWLEQNELEASELPGNRRAFEELTLLEHDYALLDRSRGVFDSLLQNGLIAPSGRPVIPPGGAPEPFVSEVNTRARARARFLVENHSRTDLEMNWSYVRCTSDGRYRELFDPCAEEYGDWQMP
jgi:proteasome accessory factor A